MRTYFRAQQKGYSFEQMQSHVSSDGGDGCGEEYAGICATISDNDLIVNTVMQAMNDDDDIVIFEAIELIEIYDGYRVQPVRELMRLTVKQFKTEVYKDESVYAQFLNQ